MDVNGNWLWAAPSFEIEVNRNNQSGTSESSANAAPKGLLYMKGSNNNGSSDNYFNNSDNSKENSNRNISRTKKSCGLCGGKGWIPSTTGPNFGQSDKWCSECNKTVPANHYHQTCPSCNGKKEW
jgi:hypothetical protein